MRRSIGQVGTAFRWALRHLLALALAAIVLLVCMQVVARYVTGTPTFAVAEISRLLFIWMAFLGAAYLVSRRELITIDLVQEYASPAVKRHLANLVDLSSLVFLLFVAWFGVRLIGVIGSKIAPATGMPFWLFYAPLPVTGLLGAFFVAEPYLAGDEPAVAPPVLPAKDQTA